MARLSSSPEEAFITTMARSELQHSIAPRRGRCSCSKRRDSTLCERRITRLRQRFLMPATVWAFWFSMSHLMFGRVSKRKYDYARFFKDWWQQDIDAMVKRDRNHPSIIIWGIGNEIPEVLRARARLSPNSSPIAFVLSTQPDLLPRRFRGQRMAPIPTL